MKNITHITHELCSDIEDINDIFSCITSSIRNDKAPHEQDIKDIKKKISSFSNHINKLEMNYFKNKDTK